MPCWAEYGEIVPRGVVARTEDPRRERTRGSPGLKFIWCDHRIEGECTELVTVAVELRTT